jgi:hypothetical protein
MPSPLPSAPRYEPSTGWRTIALIVAVMAVVIVVAALWLVSM